VFDKGYKIPSQQQSEVPGKQHRLKPEPINDWTADKKPYKPAGKLEGLSLLITGADSGIGRAVAILYGLEGAESITLSYLPQEEDDAADVEKLLKDRAPKTKILHAPADLRDEAACAAVVKKHVDAFGRIDTLVLNHAYQMVQQEVKELSTDQWRTTFETNIHSFFYTVKAALPHIPHKVPSSIIMTASVNPEVGHPQLLDYTSTKGAMTAFMRALSNQIVGDTSIRVNCVAPGPIWTPLIPATMPREKVESFGQNKPMQRAGQPVEVATCFVFLASADSSYISGQIIHVNGGEASTS